MLSIHSIRQSFLDYRKEDQLHHFDIARMLHISEGELIASHIGIEVLPIKLGEMQAIRLRPEWAEIISAIEPLGEVMALTRNSACVHEKIGSYKNVSKEGPIGLLVGEIDLRIFYSNWAHGFAVSEMGSKGIKRSLQFFDLSGIAVHKIHLRPNSVIAAYEELVVRFACTNQAVGMVVRAKEKPKSELSDQDIDIKHFHQAWRAMQDTHEFYALLKQFQLSRIQGLRLGEPEFVLQIPSSSTKYLLELAAKSGVAIMVFVGNSGMIQIHSGSVDRIVAIENWLNVMDPRFNLHLREDLVASAWIVRKPTADGIVSSLELFNADGESIAMFFGARKPGKPELGSWRAILEDVVTQSKLIGVEA